MWNNYIGTEIGRANRNLLLVNALIVFAVLAVWGGSANYLYNALAGPFPMGSDQLAAIKDVKDLKRYFVFIGGVQVKSAGLQTFDQTVDKYTRKVKSESLAATYFAMPVRNRIVLVKSPDAAPAKDYQGALIPVPKDVRDWYEDKLRPRNLNFDDVFMPYILDATPFRGMAYWELAIGLPFLALGLYNIFKGVKRAGDYRLSPIAIELAKIGPPEQVAAAIQNEIAQCGNRSPLKGTMLTTSWLAHSTYFGLRVIHLNDVVWVYQKVTKHRTNGVPTGTTFAVNIAVRNAPGMECSGKQAAIVQLIQNIHASVPWIFTGYSPEMSAKFTAKPAEFAAAVQQRREQMLNARQA